MKTGVEAEIEVKTERGGGRGRREMKTEVEPETGEVEPDVMGAETDVKTYVEPGGVMDAKAARREREK